jgi:hypothetical protein
MTDELHLLREVFQYEEVPGASATEHVSRRLQAAMAMEQDSHHKSVADDALSAAAIRVRDGGCSTHNRRSCGLR